MLQVKKLSFGYSEKPFLRNLNFSIQKGEIVSLIGASGCGKSTLLRAIYGLHQVKGEITWNGKELLGPDFNLVPGEESIKYLSQDFDLMPPLTVADNVGKYLSNAYPRKKEQRVKELLELVEMREMSDVKAKFLSGGQQQRVALARVLAKPPEILLLDEPFSHIDQFRRNKLRRNLFSYFRKERLTVIIATHDSTDALSFADKTLVMQNGRIIAKGSPKQLFEEPKNKYVASLFGEVNELPARILLSEESSQNVILYPHEISFSEDGKFAATVINCFFRGSHFLVVSELEGREIFFEHPEEIASGSGVKLEISEELLRKRLR